MVISNICEWSNYNKKKKSDMNIGCVVIVVVAAKTYAAARFIHADSSETNKSFNFIANIDDDDGRTTRQFTSYSFR